ncbi:type I restriction endonuclease subunit R [Acidimicrobium ferrooxidans]|nr:type I restriction endonuclease subunit R [Acidimicrobium ferrooxidans]
MSIVESDVEEAAIEWLKALGWDYIHGPLLAPDGEAPERSSYASVILEGRLRQALQGINDHLSSSILDEVAKTVLRLDSLSLEENNHAFHKMVRSGIEVQVKKDGRTRGDLAWLFDYENPDKNDWLVVNQLTVVEGSNNRRPDLVLYVNGLPLAVIELKNPADEHATHETAWNQLQLYMTQIPVLFNTNEVLVISDGVEARVGSLTAGFERFGPWRTIDGTAPASDAMPKLQVVLEGLFEKRRFLDYLYNFILWETEDGYIKKIAGYHQFHAVNKAVAATLRASGKQGDKRIGVVWHTQGSGKSISMCFFAGKVILEPEMNNPTLVIITDRNDLDGQLFNQFCAAGDLITGPRPVQAGSREDLRHLLQVASGGVVFSTIQKFSLSENERTTGASFPVLSDRRNIVVIADEAHRTQYGFDTRIDPKTGQVNKGLAQNLREALPSASFIGFTGTPIEFDDRSTPAVFGDYVDTYTIRQSVEDGATVPIHYEARLARIKLPEGEKPKVDDEFEEVTEDAEEATREKLKTTWAKLEALVGTEKRLGLIADDMIDHWGRRLEILDGKAMIVCMSRRICVDLYKEIVARRPDWHGEEDETGAIKVVMTGAASDPVEFHPHVRGKLRQKAIEKRFKDPDDLLKLVIVRDMWLTGFDVPCAHTLYLDKPMKGHGLLQAIARVNRRFKDKPAGVVVDYLGLAEQLKQAIGRYGGGEGEKPGIPIDLALAVLVEKTEIVRAIFHGYDYTGYFSIKATERLSALAGGADHICGLEPGDPDSGKKRYVEAMTALNRAAGIALHLEGARQLRDEIGYFQAVQANIVKYTVGGAGKTDAEMNAAIRQIISGAITSEGILDVFGEAGIARPDISVLSDEFLQTLRTSEHKNLQLELLKKLINDEIKAQGRRNVVQARKFSELLEGTLLRYQNRTIEAAQVILELIDLAKEMRDAPKRGAALGLTEDELAFYDALVDHGDVKEVMGDEILAAIAHDLVESIRGSVTIDWTQKESVRADMRRKVKKLLRKHGYPPDKRAKAVLTIIEQAERVCRDWACVAS